MAVDPGYLEFLKDAFADFGEVSIRKMFGGAGVYRDGVMFGLVAGATLYLRADPATSPAFAAEGKGPFVYEARGKSSAMPYWEVPERLLEDGEELAEWAGKAVAVARAAKTGKPGGKR
jgi:DNA transformation protein